jgi:hypothetical protein
LQYALFSTTSSRRLGESRLVDVVLDTGTKLDAIEVASVELIGGAELACNTRLAGDSARKAQRRRIDVGGMELGGSACGAQWGG